jgi:hypothetical protein
MTGIQIILISGLLLTWFLYFIRRRNTIADIIVLAVIIGVAVTFILLPEWTNVIAHKLGVGRGADMVFYLCILLFCFIVLKLYARLRKLEQMITELLRKEALRESKKPTN